MKNSICFFSVGFAFNRLNRMKFYEKIFPRNVQMFLFTTNKYEGKEKQNYQYNWDGLRRTKIIYADYNPLKLPFELRKFCEKNKIERIINIGNYLGCIPLFIATILSKRSYAVNLLSDVLNQYKYTKNLKQSFIFLVKLFALYPLVVFSKKVFMNDLNNFRRAPIFFWLKRRHIYYLPPPINTSFYKPMKKVDCRKKLKIPVKSEVIIFVGRVNYLKCSDLLKELIHKNKDILFLVVGEVLDKSILNIASPNLRLLGKKSSSELPEYYNASDLGFFINRGGAGMGFANIEALSCGVPILVSDKFEFINSEALLKVRLEPFSVNQAIKLFFSLSKSHRRKLSLTTRRYAKENYSYEKWKDKYIESYLN